MFYDPQTIHSIWNEEDLPQHSKESVLYPFINMTANVHVM
jgi:hypothetical protein